jgi:hypothetical protein
MGLRAPAGRMRRAATTVRRAGAAVRETMRAASGR